MPAFTLTRDQARALIDAVEHYLSLGHLPPDHAVIGSHKKTAVRMAADQFGVEIETTRGQIGTPTRPGRIFRNYGLVVDWSKYRPPAPPPPPPPSPPEPEPPPEQPSDPIELRRLKDQLARARTQLREAEQRAAIAEDIRAGVLGLTAEPLRPRLIVPDRDPGTGGRTVILHLSDVHYGETVLLDEMDGLNRYDAKIAQDRVARFFDRAISLMTEHWKGDPPDEIILCLGGDLISGAIHAELRETNLPAVPATVREVGEHIAGGVVRLRLEVERPVRVLSVPGNHGRMTEKPQSKGRSAGSLDLLATDFCEAATRGAGVKDVEFYKAMSPDAYFSVYGWHWLLTHGDTMGGRNAGTGFLGPINTIAKGHRKLVDTSWRSGRPVHFVLTAHFHTTVKTAFGWGNGSVVGYGEYARDLRADPETARQNMLIVHPRHGVIADQPLYLGHPQEGSLYAGPASVVRPQWSEGNG